MKLIHTLCFITLAFVSSDCKQEEPKKAKVGVLFYSFRSVLPTSAGPGTTYIDVNIDGPEANHGTITARSSSTPDCLDYTNYGHILFLLEPGKYHWEAKENPSGTTWNGVFTANAAQCSGVEIR
ncbi:hypothetical protein [Spirosoma litoris]